MINFKPNEKFTEVVSLLKSGTIKTHVRSSDFDEYKEFIKQFPAPELTSLSLDQYCIGKKDNANFCWWIERGLTKALGRFSPGSSRGHIIYYNKNGDIYKNDKLKDLTDNDALIYTLKIQSVIANADPSSDLIWIDNDDEIYKHAEVEKLVTIGNARKLRLLSCYNPELFIPISSSKHLGHFLKVFGCPDDSIPSSDKPIARMLLLLELYKLACKEIELENLSTFAFMKALYSEELNIAPKKDEDSITRVIPKIWKISHGRNGDFSNEEHNWLLENNYVAINHSPEHKQHQKFEAIKPNDYFYLVRDAQIILLGQLENEPSKEIEDMPGRQCRKFKPLTSLNLISEEANLPKRVIGYKMDEEPFNSNEIKCNDELRGLGFMPRGQTTVFEVGEAYLEDFESSILKPVFDLSLENLFITPSSDENRDDSEESTGNKIHSLNQILFGPPGTGKTYNTVNKAIAIANPSFKLDQAREEIKAEFDRLMEEGQIVFTTFHQSMCYEDFIEGIKPQTTPDDNRVIYKVEPGIFKRLCQAATTPNLIGFNAAYEQLIKDLSEIEATDSDTTEVKTIEIKTPTAGKSFSISLNSNNNLSLHTGPNKIKQNTLTRDNIQEQIIGHKNHGVYFEGVCNYLKENYHYSSTTENIAKNFVLIIDEINRGNVSQIFGELITLIEEDKRLGRNEALKVTLPYSKDVPFGVPKNLYIIGTMNTADRSVEALDAALRRRFSFEEMPPNSKLIATEGELKETQGVLGEINLPSLLDIINYRLEKLLDKDHQIGHSYFISVKNLDGLKLAFQNKIIPLLQEYFFGDYGKIGLVLGKGFVEKVPNKSSFADFPDADANDFSERPIFTIKTPTSNNEFVVAIKSLLNQAHDDE